MTHHYREDETRTQVKPIKWGESISERTCQALRELGWADPNEVQLLKAKIKDLEKANLWFKKELKLIKDNE